MRVDMSRIVGPQVAVIQAAQAYYRSGTAQRSSRLFGVVEVLSAEEKSPTRLSRRSGRVARRSLPRPQSDRPDARRSKNSVSGQCGCSASSRPWQTLGKSELGREAVRKEDIDRLVAAFVERIEKGAPTDDDIASAGGGGAFKAE